MTNRFQTASHWGVYNVAVGEESDALSAAPFSRDPYPSALNDGLPEMARSRLRVDQPYVREGFLRNRARSRHRRGAERFIAISWEAALDLVEGELRRVTTEFGNEAIYGGSYGWASAGRLHHSPSVLKRFLGLNGGYVDKIGNHSYGAAFHIMPYVIGRGDIPHHAMPWPLIVENTRLMVLFGGAHLKNAQIDSGGTVLHETENWLKAARDAGVEFVNVSPSQDDVSDLVPSLWLPVRPNTDVAVMLGIAHTLVTEKLHCQQFLDRYCAGYAQFERYLLGKSDGQPKSADWAAEISDISAEKIRCLARRMAKTRTMIATTWSIQRAQHGEQPVWMTVVLASILGQIGLPGGGYSLGLAAINGVAMPQPGDMPRPKLPLGQNRVSSHVPVGRVADMLLNPGATLEYNGRSICYPDIRLVYSVGGNPFHHNCNLNRFLKAWQRPEVVIVHEPWWGPAAKFADVVLPATTTLERNDIQASELSRFYIAMRKAISPFKQSRNDIDVFAELAHRLGFGEAYTEGRDEMGWLRHMYEEARGIAQQRGYALPTFDEFWAVGLHEFPVPKHQEPFLGSFRRDPDANRLATPSGKIEIYSDAIASYGYDDCPPHPSWIEPAEWLGGTLSKRFPIHLLSNQPSVRLHSQLDPTRLSLASKIAGREPLLMNESDAIDRGLKTGDVVRVFNDRGSFIAAAKIVDHLRPGVAQIATGAWYDPAIPGQPGSLEKHGNPNVVTNDGGTSRLGQSSMAQTALVQIEPCPNPPRLTAFDLPAIEVAQPA